MKARRNICLVLAYDGTCYHGWQNQKELPTIQAVCEEKIARLSGEKAVLYGAGRTDAGVHALGQVANFYTGTKIPCAGLKQGLNSLLPPDIRVVSARDKEENFHAQYSAQGKSYIFRLAYGAVHLPTERLYSVFVPGDLDVLAMKACLMSLAGVHDFASFAASGSADYAHTGKGFTREIFSASLDVEPARQSCLRIEISGDGFLRHMVRNIVGTLVEVGRGRWSINDFFTIMAARDRTKAGPTAPAQGLFLYKVLYKDFL